MSVSRRTFLQTLLASAAAAATYDPDLALWVPGARTFIDTHVARLPLFVGDWVYWDDLILPAGTRVDHAPVLGAAYAYVTTKQRKALVKANGTQRPFGIYCGHVDGREVVARASNFSKSEMRVLYGPKPNARQSGAAPQAPPSSVWQPAPPPPLRRQQLRQPDTE